MTRILKIQFIRKIIQVFKTFFFPTFHGVCIAAPQKHQRKTYVYTPPPLYAPPLGLFSSYIFNILHVSSTTFYQVSSTKYSALD